MILNGLVMGLGNFCFILPYQKFLLLNIVHVLYFHGAICKLQLVCLITTLQNQQFLLFVCITSSCHVFVTQGAWSIVQRNEVHNRRPCKLLNIDW